MRNLFNRKTWKYPELSFWENFFGGNVSIGNLTIWGENAMHWGVTYHTTTWGYICLRLPLRCFGKWHPLYFYVSCDATPSCSTFYVGKCKEEKHYSKYRRFLFGHNFPSSLVHGDNHEKWKKDNNVPRSIYNEPM